MEIKSISREKDIDFVLLGLSVIQIALLFASPKIQQELFRIINFGNTPTILSRPLALMNIKNEMVLK